MIFFHFLAKKISYTFAVVFITVFMGWIITAIVFFLGASFIIVSYQKLSIYIIKWLPVAVAVPTFLHYVEFGFLSPLKIPAFFRSLRIINTSYKNKSEIRGEDLIAAYRYVSDLPVYNTLTAAFNISLTAVIIIGLSYYEYKFLGTYTFLELKVIIKAVSLTLLIVINLYCMSTYLITEKLTNGERSDLYNKILESGTRIKPRALIGIRVKFFLIVWLMIIILLSLAAIIDKIRFFGEYTLTVLASYFLAAAVICILFMLITTNSVVRILRDLMRVTRTIASGGTTGYEVLSLEQEFTDIEYALMEMAWEIDEYRKNTEGKVAQRTQELQEALTELRGKDDQIQKQLDMASIIQRSILPGRINDWNELKFAVRYMAMEKIGGDFYDVHLLKDDKIGIIIADVSGHGIPAALVTTMAKMSFNNAGAKFDSPKKIFQEVNQNILDHVKTKEYMTSFMLAINEEYEVTYTNASHQKAIVLRMATGSIELLDTDGLFIGAVEEARDTYDEKRIKLEYGDRIILYTDGIPEAINVDREEFSNARLEKAILKYRHYHVEEFADAIINEVRQYIGNAQLVDDITFLAVELVRDEAIEIVKNSKRLIRTHDNEAAIAALEQGLVQYPNNQKILYNLAKAYFRVNDFKKTAEIIEQYIHNDKMNKYAFYIGGAAYYQIADYARSIALFEKALELDATFVNALFALGMAYKKLGDNQSATRSFEKIISIDPDNKMALFEIKSLVSTQ
jgi:sigma-B regulation protein RsbU (phosphoserine phosphatase)